MTKPPPLWMTNDEQIAQWKRAFPDKKIRKRSPANALTEAVRDYATLKGCATARVNTTGLWVEKEQKFLTTNATKGFEDIDVILPIVINGIRVGLKVAVEVKIGDDRQSKFQKLRQQRVQEAGGVYMIAKTFDQFKIDFDAVIKKYGST